LFWQFSRVDAYGCVLDLMIRKKNWNRLPKIQNSKTTQGVDGDVHGGNIFCSRHRIFYTHTQMVMSFEQGGDPFCI
jgi:hypothetical protein